MKLEDSDELVRFQGLPFVKAIGSDQEVLVSSDGEPVWPVRTADELTALTELAQVFGAGLREVQATPGFTITGSELVIALGECNVGAARLYAHLTKRRLRVVTDLFELGHGEVPSIVVSAPERLTSEMLDRLYGHENEASAPGLVLATTPESLRRQVLLRAAAIVFRGVVNTTRRDIIPLADSIDELDVLDLKILGGGAAPSALRSAMQDNAGVLSITTVSDGIDASLGRDRVLCAMDRPGPSAREDLSPRCRVTGMCHRLGVPVKEALDSSALLSPDTVRARILIWNACWGLRPPEHVLDQAWGLGRRLLDSPTLGAIVTSWQMTITSPEYAMKLAEDLSQGLPVGEAVARFNRSDFCRRVQQRMCLLGDPLVRLSVPTRADWRTSKPRSGIKTARLSNLGDVSVLGDVSLVRACATQAASAGGGDASAAAVGKAAADAIARYEPTRWQALKAGGIDLAELAMRNAVLRFLLRNSRPFFKDWLPFARTLRAEVSPRPCFACGAAPNVTVARFRTPGVSPRRLSVCSRCSAFSDTQIGSEVTISVAVSGGIRMVGASPSEAATAAVCLWSSLPGESVTLDWPVGPDGGPAESVDIPKPWPPGPLRLSVAIVSGRQVAYFTYMTRARLCGLSPAPYRRLVP